MMNKLAFLVVGSVLIVSAVNAQLNLVGNQVETLIDDRNKPAKLIELVTRALPETDLNITSTTQAWSGSGLVSGRFNGYIDHYTLNNERSRYLYSDIYAEIDLHMVSRTPAAENIVRFDQLRDERVGIEKRFANTDQLRSERSVKWARRDSFVENIQQLEERRVDFILADKMMIEEFNKLLSSIDKPPLSISEQPILTVGVKMALNPSIENARDILASFNAGIAALREEAAYKDIMMPAEDAPSALDESLYAEVLRKW
ncbi:MAG: transporter substrate-binding domain-containing protein [Pseudomonadota bacterium]